ncbi:hypothetical protein LTR10_013304 [Elasticomyces elasticus]|uniref:J domain-containing protein n=1 Tax=Exophiala sideris TaxID=1016849 RepID=A0ABR0J4V2_9EURO|nr:hypothetical protein LTR10_013304 [Elasticomyces elasticus]KAK5027467.1 hypothetical protein LTS07_007069 [Exophiala sideris]KAK5034829.1 hypothetical protein LTR13_006011 [Exophiala sideris]KAK5056435.1 hypothetical protein LTR69_007976 [Exophiala sideris]KAK5181075.1 hypothetical protein LTR44_006406 [Eurotiomycetes sp. CCFEE 6388]
MRLRILHLFVLATLLLLAAAWSKDDYEIFKLKDEVEAAEGSDVSFYDFLGVKPSATVDEIGKAFRKKSRALHPDKVKHSYVASRSTPTPKKAGEKKKSGVHVSKGPSEREIQRFTKQAGERYSRLGVVANILKGPQRERYRPGLGTVLVGLFLVFGGGAHYFVLVTSYNRQREFMERYIRYARKTAWGDELGIRGIPQPVEVPATAEEPDPMANLNRRQKRELERQNKKEKPGKNKATPKVAPVQSSTSERRRVTAENGKILVVDSTGDVFLEEEDEDGNVQEFLLDIDEIHKPTIWDTGIVRLPVWFYRKAFDPFLKNTDPIPSDDAAPSVRETVSDTIEMVVPDKVTNSDLSSSQDSGFEIVDSTGIEKELEKASAIKKRGKKGKK